MYILNIRQKEITFQIPKFMDYYEQNQQIM